ncbi:hypothetical protein EON67_00115, partial [archaeon]
MIAWFPPPRGAHAAESAAMLPKQYPSFTSTEYALSRLTDEVSAAETVAAGWYPAGTNALFAYERCRATQRCPRAASAYNITEASLRFTKQVFRSGVVEPAGLFLSFDDWRQGSLGVEMDAGYLYGVLGAQGTQLPVRSAAGRPASLLTGSAAALAEASPAAANGSRADEYDAAGGHFNTFALPDTSLNGHLYLNHTCTLDVNTDELRIRIRCDTWPPMHADGKQANYVPSPREDTDVYGILEFTRRGVGAPAAVFHFLSVYLGPRVHVTCHGSRALALVSRSSMVIDTPITAPPGMLGGFSGGAADVFGILPPVVHLAPSNGAACPHHDTNASLPLQVRNATVGSTQLLRLLAMNDTEFRSALVTAMLDVGVAAAEVAVTTLSTCTTLRYNDASTARLCTAYTQPSGYDETVHDEAGLIATAGPAVATAVSHFAGAMSSADVARQVRGTLHARPFASILSASMLLPQGSVAWPVSVTSVADEAAAAALNVTTPETMPQSVSAWACVPPQHPADAFDAAPVDAQQPSGFSGWWPTSAQLAVAAAGGGDGVLVGAASYSTDATLSVARLLEQVRRGTQCNTTTPISTASARHYVAALMWNSSADGGAWGHATPASIWHACTAATPPDACRLLPYLRPDVCALAHTSLNTSVEPDASKDARAGPVAAASARAVEWRSAVRAASALAASTVSPCGPGCRTYRDALYTLSVSTGSAREIQAITLLVHAGQTLRGAWYVRMCLNGLTRSEASSSLPNDYSTSATSVADGCTTSRALSVGMEPGALAAALNADFRMPIAMVSVSKQATETSTTSGVRLSGERWLITFSGIDGPAPLLQVLDDELTGVGRVTQVDVLRPGSRPVGDVELYWGNLPSGSLALHETDDVLSDRLSAAWRAGGVVRVSVERASLPLCRELQLRQGTSWSLADGSAPDNHDATSAMSVDALAQSVDARMQRAVGLGMPVRCVMNLQPNVSIGVSSINTWYITVTSKVQDASDAFPSSPLYTHGGGTSVHLRVGMPSIGPVASFATACSAVRSLSVRAPQLHANVPNATALAMVYAGHVPQLSHVIALSAL